MTHPARFRAILIHTRQIKKVSDYSRALYIACSLFMREPVGIICRRFRRELTSTIPVRIEKPTLYRCPPDYEFNERPNWIAN